MRMAQERLNRFFAVMIDCFCLCLCQPDCVGPIFRRAVTFPGQSIPKPHEKGIHSLSAACRAAVPAGPEAAIDPTHEDLGPINFREDWCYCCSRSSITHARLKRAIQSSLESR